VETQLQTFLASVLDGGKLSASRPCRCVPEVKAPVNLWFGGRQGGQLWTLWRYEFLSPLPGINPGTLGRSAVA